jgi:SPP1 gp7 family putative phage head morphogenesis protein
MQPNAATKITNTFLHAHINLERFGEYIRKEITDLLDKAQTEIIGRIAMIDPAAPTLTQWQNERFTKLNLEIAKILAGTYETIKAGSQQELEGMAKVVGEASPDLLNAAIGVDLFSVTLTEELLGSIVQNTMIDGHIIGAWWDKQEEDVKQSLQIAMNKAKIDVQLGLLKGDSIGQMISMVRGSPVLPGPMAASKRNAAALVRTSVMQVTQAVRQEMYDQNKDVLKGYEIIAVLDDRTTPLCMSLDRKQYDLNFQPIPPNKMPYPGQGGPPFHWNCRTTLIPLTLSYNELAGKPDLPKDKQDAIEELSKSERVSMSGPVKAGMDYKEWLEEQPVETQIDVLGPTRQKLFADGKLTALSDLLHQSGRPLTLDQLSKKMGGKS